MNLLQNSNAVDGFETANANKLAKETSARIIIVDHKNTTNH